MLKKLAMLICLPALLYGGAIEYDIGATYEDSVLYVNDVVTIRPSFVTRDSGKVVCSKTPFYKWSHWYTRANKDEYTDYTHSFGYIYNRRNKHSFKSLNTYENKRKEWDFSGTYEYMSVFGVKQSKTKTGYKYRAFVIGVEPGIAWNMIPDDKSLMGRAGANFTWKKMGKEDDGEYVKEYDYEPLVLSLHGRTNFSDRPCEFWTTIRVEPTDNLYAEFKLKGYYDKDWKFTYEPTLYMGVTGSLF